MTREQWTWIGAIAVTVIALAASFVFGRITASEPTQQAAVDATETTIPEYGDAASRDAYTVAVRGSIPPDSPVTDEDLLVAGDSLCADLEGFSNQGRDAHYAIRILWTDDLRYLDSEEVAVFGVVLAAAPRYLCPQYVVLADDIAYWLGI
jgi:FlaG/FlaF family flagellin (archaellin)